MKRVQSRGYMDWVRTLDCIVCKRQGMSEPHHWQKKGHGGMGTKCSDFRCVPLCFYHHRAIHTEGVLSFMKHNGLSMEFVEKAITFFNNKWSEKDENKIVGRQ